MAVLLVTHPAYAEHNPGEGHPERPARLKAVLAGAEQAGLAGELTERTPRPATRAEVERVHSPTYVAALEKFCREGGGALDGDTAVVRESWEAALLAAGAGLSAVEELSAHGAQAAFCAVRPPGHHAIPERAMGFCLFNNVAVTAAALAAQGERPLVVDIDAHHGNGTQDAFYNSDEVAYVSFHQSPLYPGTGSLLETGDGPGRGWTVNVPLPPGATGDTYRDGIERLVAPLAEEFRPTWLLISAGFDGHRADPLTDLALTAGDYGDIVADLTWLTPTGRRLAFLEGGYDLDALRLSSGAALTALAGDIVHEEPPSCDGPGGEVVSTAAAVHRQALQG